MTRVSAKYRDSTTINQPKVSTDVGVVVDAMGQIDLSLSANWKQFALRTAKVEVGLGDKVFVSQELRVQVSHTVTYRRDSTTSTITPEMQVVWFGVKLNIVDIQDRGPKGREIVLICKEAE